MSNNSNDPTGGLVNLDPNRFFDSKNYSTLVVHSDGHTSSENEISELVVSLIEKGLTKEEKEEALSRLKKANAQKFLTESISAIKDPVKKAILIAACWESGLDFSKDFLFFVKLAGHEDYTVAMEAYTVIENTDGKVAETELLEARTFMEGLIAENANKFPLLQDILTIVNNRLSNHE